jgi:hypothetical protein
LSRREALRAGVLSTVVAGGVTAAAPSASAAGSVSFPPGTVFKGSSTVSSSEGAGQGVDITFSIQATGDSSVTFDPRDIAEWLSQYVQSKGLPAVTFYGTPAPAALNP